MLACVLLCLRVKRSTSTTTTNTIIIMMIMIIRVIITCIHTLRILYKTAAEIFFPNFQASGKRNYFFASSPQTQPQFTYKRGIARGCSIHVAVGEDQQSDLRRMSGTDVNVFYIFIGDLPPCRHGHSLFSIINHGAIIDFVNMQRHVQVGAVALRGAG
jgi:hypothetical protein